MSKQQIIKENNLTVYTGKEICSGKFYTEPTDEWVTMESCIIAIENLTKHNIRKPQSVCKNPDCKCHKPEYTADVTVCCTGCKAD